MFVKTQVDYFNLFSLNSIPEKLEVILIFFLLQSFTFCLVGVDLEDVGSCSLDLQMLAKRYSLAE